LNLTIRLEGDDDLAAIRRVNQLAFGGIAEADLVDALRDGGYVEVSLVADVDGGMVGHILFSRITVTTEAGTIPALSLAPMAVLPNRQRQGIGKELVRAGLDVCREKGHDLVLVLGHPDFYQQFGFSPELVREIESPFGGGEAWMGLRLNAVESEPIRGKVVFSPPFGELG
jgi:putative acetyltransferase